jgi:uncharacterized protein (TIGR00369 family)
VTAPLTRRDYVRAFLPASPFARLLGIELIDLAPDGALLSLPFKPELATAGDVVHGGALATLIDTAGVVAAWSDDTVPERYEGSTVGLSIVYADAARGEDLTAVAEVIRRGGRLCFVDVTVIARGDRVVARGTVTVRFA